MIEIHHLENSRSQRVIWLCEALGADYKVIHYKRNPITKRAGKEFSVLHPLGKSPVVGLEGKNYVESGAIFQLLLDHFDKDNKLSPPTDSDNYRDFIFWMHFAEGSLMGPLVMRYMHSVVSSKVPFFMKPMTKLIFGGIESAYLKDTIDSMFNFIDHTLVDKKYLLGDQLSAADIMMSFPLEVSVGGRVEKGRYKNIEKYVANLKTNEHYLKALEVGGPYDY